VTGLKWFKIHEDGLIAANQSWGVDRMVANKGKVTVTIPSCIAAGQYLLRHEMIGGFILLLLPVPLLLTAEIFAALHGSSLLLCKPLNSGRADLLFCYLGAVTYPGAQFYVREDCPIAFFS
jgi:hypothetical protein